MKKKMVDVEIDISDDLFLAVAKEAHKEDITINEMFCKILREAMENDRRNKNTDTVST